MRAIVVKAPGGPEVLELGEVPDPRPGPGELLVRVRAAGVNRADLLQRLGRYPPPPGEPETLGLEIAGEVLEPAAPFQRGDRVMALLGGGGYAELARVPAPHALPIPEGMGVAEAAAIPEAFLTAWLNLFMLGRLAPGEVVVVHAAASGVGSAALQLRRGAGRGADLIFDLVGASYLEADVAALGLQGRLCCISTMGGSKGTLDVGALLTRRLTVMGSTLRTRSPAQKAKLVADFAQKALPRFRTGQLRPVVGRTYPLAQAREAHAALERNEVVGKIVLLV